MKKRKLNPLYDEKCKKQAIENKAKYDVKRKQQGLGKDIFLHQIKFIIIQELRCIREMWSKIHERHPSRDIDIDIIDEILGMNKLKRYYIQSKKHQIQ